MRLHALSRVLEEDYRGPRASFSAYDVLKSIVVIGENGRLGRTKLASTMELGVGEVRTMIKRLKDSGLIRVSSNGCELTDVGQKNYSAVKKVVYWRSEVQAQSLGIGKYCWAFIIRGKSHSVKLGIEQRDAAIKAGASGVLTIMFSKDQFLIPVEGTNCEPTKPSEPWMTIRKSSPQDGDVVIISGASDSQQAEKGGWSAAMTFL